MFPKDPAEPKLVTWMRNRAVRRTLILCCLWFFLCLILVRFRFVLLPFGLALILAFIMEPVVAFGSGQTIRGKPIPRAAVIISCYVVSGALLTLFGGWAVAQIGRELSGITKLSSTVVAEFQHLSTQVLDWSEQFAQKNSIPIDRAAMEAAVTGNLSKAGATVAQNATTLLSFGRNIVGATFQTIFGLFLVLMLTAFLSIDKKRIERFFFSLVPPEVQGAYGTILSGMTTGLAGVVRGQVSICLVNGVLTFVGLWLLDVKLPLILGTIATVFSLIPIFGSILSTLPIVAMALLDSLPKAIFALLWIIGIHLVEANFLNPKIMGNAAKIHPVVVVFVLIVGERSAGLIGALFAVPIAAVVITVFKFLHHRALDTSFAGKLPHPLPKSEDVAPTMELSPEIAREQLAQILNTDENT